MAFVWLNGICMPESKACIPISDRGFLFGDGLFTTIKVVDGALLHLERHLHRLEEQCRFLKIDFPTIPPAALAELIEHNDAGKGVWRLKIIITAGGAPTLALPFRPCGQLLITLAPYAAAIPKPARLALFPEPLCKPNSRLKSLSYLDRLQVKQYALDNGAFDAVVLSPEGYLLETAFSNIFWCTERALYTPSKELHLLPGIALELCCSAAKELGMDVVEVKCTLEGLPPSCPLYTCNAMTGIVPINSLGERSFLPNSHIEKMFIKYFF